VNKDTMDYMGYVFTELAQVKNCNKYNKFLKWLYENVEMAKEDIYKICVDWSEDYHIYRLKEDYTNFYFYYDHIPAYLDGVVKELNKKYPSSTIKLKNGKEMFDFMKNEYVWHQLDSWD
tara:strand:+ start:15059 stop:15415 length:357 start_codon:yes stop_codon:yes gene_type:complete